MEKTGLVPKDSKWLTEYHKAVTALINDLGGEVKVQEEYGEIAKSWNEREPPEEVKQK